MKFCLILCLSFFLNGCGLAILHSLQNSDSNNDSKKSDFGRPFVANWSGSGKINPMLKSSAVCGLATATIDVPSYDDRKIILTNVSIECDGVTYRFPDRVLTVNNDNGETIEDGVRIGDATKGISWLGAYWFSFKVELPSEIKAMVPEIGSGPFYMRFNAFKDANKTPNLSMSICAYPDGSYLGYTANLYQQ